jgi:hypothetical protein
MQYKYLIFKPAIPSDYCAKENMLWKAEVIVPANYQSVASTMLEDNIQVNNRRRLEDWEKLLDENGFKYDKNFEHDFCKGYVIFDVKFTSYELHLFACDINAADYKVEVAHELIHPLLFVLDLKKEGIIFPYSLLKKIETAREKLLLIDHDNNTVNRIVLNLLNVLEKLVDHCQSYEVDIFYGIMDD